MTETKRIRITKVLPMGVSQNNNPMIMLYFIEGGKETMKIYGTDSYYSIKIQPGFDHIIELDNPIIKSIKPA